MLIFSLFIPLIKINIVNASIINCVYDSGNWGGTGDSYRIMRIHPSGISSPSALSQTFHVNETCQLTSLTVRIGAGLSYADGWFQIVISTTDDSYGDNRHFPNESDIIDYTDYYNRADYVSRDNYNFSLLVGAVLTPDIQYSAYIYAYNGSWSSTTGYRLYWYYDNLNTDENENSNYFNLGVWYNGLQVYDRPILIYGDTEFDKLEASSENYNSNENGIETEFYCYWIAKGAVTLSGYIFSYGLSGNMNNGTWVEFSDINETWANVSITLNFSSISLGEKIYYKWFANSSSNNWYESVLSNFTLQATILFIYNDGGLLSRNYTIIENSTETTYSESTLLDLRALCNSTYGFLSWNYTNTINSNINNPFLFDVCNQTTITCNFQEIGTGTEPEPTPTSTGVGEYTDEDLTTMFIIGGGLSALFCGLILLVMIRKKKE